ncbi:MAG: hypothetical protein P4L77_04835 [Sulfuriferula sp.]|nr:hypothetical protein [Sulfuriferula sp.]
MSRLFIIIGVKTVHFSTASDEAAAPGASGRNNTRSGNRTGSLKRRQMNGMQHAEAVASAAGVYASRIGDKS